MSYKSNNETYFEFEEYEQPFTMIQNEFLDDKRMSFKAQGIYLQIIRFRNSKTHKITIKSLIAMKTDGKDSVANGLNELIKLGYITRKEIRNEKGQKQGYKYIVHMKPVEPQGASPEAENPIMDNPITGNQPYKRKIDLKENVLKEKSFEEEEEILLPVVTEQYLFDLAQEKITFYEITNIKTINAIKDVLLNTNTLGTNETEKAINWVIKIVQDKMKIFGQHQKAKQSNSNRKRTAIRTEIVPDWLQSTGTEQQQPAPAENTSIEEERARLEKELEMFKNKPKKSQQFA